MAKHYWFKAKKYGWGWVPSSWQGWFVLILYVTIIILIADQIQKIAYTTDISSVANYILATFFLTGTLIIICFLTGEKPEWRWGGKKIIIKRKRH